MHTFFDFVTHIKIVEYVIAIGFIAGYLLYWEFLKPRPFKRLSTAVNEDLAHLKRRGPENLKTIGRAVSIPFIGLAYVIVLPFSFLYALGIAAVRGVLALAGKEAAFGWRPTEAYLEGKKKKTGKGETDEEGE
ncbi:MAG: hypothetical protein M0Z59_05070 [Nitrospiraceae bacterium]|nr:hypothetical protein [Nitrospiraceae bacterium]